MPGKLNTSEAALFTKSDPVYPTPDLQFNFVHLPFDIIVGQGQSELGIADSRPAASAIARLGAPGQRRSAAATADQPQLPGG